MAAAAATATMTRLTVTLPAPVDPNRPPVGCARVQAVSDAGPTRHLPVGQGLPLVHFPGQPEPYLVPETLKPPS